MIDKLGFFWVLIAILSFNSLSAHPLLKKGDSLYTQNKFTEAFEVYDSIYSNGQASPAMLLKMAYIKEGLGDYVNAIIYLSDYQKITNDRDAQEKISELANEYRLEGYEASDSDYLLHVVNKYRDLAIPVVMALTLLSLAMIFRNRKNKRPQLPALVFQVFLLLLLFFLSNDFYIQKNAVVTKNESILMSGPSAGAEPVDVIDRGHKVRVFHQSGIWTAIEWNNQKVYIRRSRLAAI